MIHDLRGVWRAARRAPIFTATAVVTLAIGIGASTAMFSIVNAVLLRPLPFRDPDRLVAVFEANPSEGREQSGVAAANFLDWRSRSKTFDDLALSMTDANPSVLGIGATAIQGRMALVTPNMMSVLGVRPALGREFGSPHAQEIILSHALWHRAFGGDPAVIGQRVRVEGAAGTVIVGVMPASFALRDGIEFWMPLDPAAPGMTDRNARYLQAVGRLGPSATMESARAELAAIALGLTRDYPATNAGWTVGIHQFQEPDVERHRLVLMTLFAATTFVMLVGCANVSNLLLARGVARQSELAMRSALGASRTRIAQLLLTESLALSLAGWAAGLSLTYALMRILVRLVSRVLPAITTADLSASVLLFSLAASVVAALVAALVPVVRLSKTDLQLTVKTAGDRTTNAGTGHLQRWIVAGELALCLALVVGATLFIRTFVNLSTTDLGFNPAHVVSINARFPMYRTMARNRWQLLARDTNIVLQRLQSIPGVEAVSAINHAPLSGTLVPVSVTLAGETRGRRAFYQNVTPGYFRTVGISLLAGRDFTNDDVGQLATSPVPDPGRRQEGVVIVNQSAARLFWPNGNALGQLLSTAYDPGISGRRVVGIVSDVRTTRGETAVEVYVPYLQDPSFAMTLLVRTPLPLARMTSTIRREIQQAAPDLSTDDMRMLDDIVAESMGSTPFTTIIVSAFAAVALTLSAIGIFSVFAFGVAARTHEIGIRMALGASRNDVTRLFLREALAPIGVGLLAGTILVLALGRVIAALLFGVEPTDPISFAGAAGLVVSVALIASYLPVRHALRVDPAESLRA